MVLALLGLHVAFGLAPALGTISNDFANYYVPARLVLEGRSLDRLYERNWLQNEIRRAGIDRLGYFVPNPPPNVLLLLPVAGLDPPLAKAVWSGFLAVSLLASFLLLRAAVPFPGGWLALAFLVQSASIANALRYGPPYPLLLLLLCGSLLALGRSRPLLAGALLAPVLTLKLYGIPFLLYFAWTRRWRALAGVAVGTVLIAVASVALLGRPVHAVYLREMLPASLSARLLDPYSTAWQSVSSLSHRLFEVEADLNPSPAFDTPGLAGALARGASLALVLLAVLAGSTSAAAGDPGRLRREWAALTLASLAASPFTGTYHFVLLALPGAVLVAEAFEARRPWVAAGVLALVGFAASSLPHYFAGLASGWGNLLACPRLAAVLVLLGLSLRSILTGRRALGAVAAGALSGLTALPAPAEEPWQRVSEARGGVLAEPVACEGGLAWVTVEGERLVVRAHPGRVVRGAGDAFSPRCGGGTLSVERSVAAGADGDPAAAADRDASVDGSVTVRVDRRAGAIREAGAAGARILFRGLARHPRLSPDLGWVVFQSWERGTWDLRAVERSSGRVVAVTADAANEIEPSWMPDGARVVFASDRRRGLGFSALYTVPFRP